ncbi:MAG: hypothetical protein JXR76_21745 [Deltaproteobacteria bacterium]|nr:hypothetical protein [Deltaproteobacteria bacterium]
MRELIFCTAIAAMSLSLCGCQKGTSKPTVPSAPKETAPKEPDYTRFGALKKVTFDVTLPFFAGSTVDNDTPCFVKVEDIKTTAADDRLPHRIDKNIESVTATIMDWFLEDLKPDLVTLEVTKNWKVSFDDLVAKELDAEELRFAEDPKCFTNQGWLPDNHHLITAVFGARKILFESTVPLTDDIRKAIKSAAAGKDIEMTTGGLGDDPQNPEPVTEWELSFKKPMFFGAKEISKHMWRKEDNKYDCELIYVTGAKQKPVTPECVQYRESKFSFSIVKGGEKPVSVTVATKGKKKTVPLNWQEVVKLRVSDRIYLWLRAEKVEVGSSLRINSVVLNPVPIPGEKTEEEEEDEMVINENDVQKEDDKPRPAKSNNPVDAYLYN